MAEPAENVADLPKSLVKRIVKAKLSEVDKAAGGDGSRDFQINKDALLAFCESGKIFIHYLTATANDVCKEAKRQTISADDVLTALEDLEFGELVPVLREALDAYRVEAKEKNRRKAEQSKKRKAAEKELAEGAAAADAADGGGAGTVALAAGEGLSMAGHPAAERQQQQQQAEQAPAAGTAAGAATLEGQSAEGQAEAAAEPEAMQVEPPVAAVEGGQ